MKKWDFWRVVRIGALDVVAGLETTERLRVGARARLVHRTRSSKSCAPRPRYRWSSCLVAPASARRRSCRSGWPTTTGPSPGSTCPDSMTTQRCSSLTSSVCSTSSSRSSRVTKRQLAAVTIDFSSVLVPRLERTIAERARPFVLVIDDAHRLRRRAVWALVQALADCVPSGSQLVLVSRSDRPRARPHARRSAGSYVVRCQPRDGPWRGT